MSKNKSLKSYQLASCENVRHTSTMQLKKDFKAGSANDGEFYDKRTYYDSETGESYYPWMFSKTLDHDNVTGFPKASDVEKIIKGAKEGGSSLNDVPIHNLSVRKLEGLAAANSFNLIGTDSSVPRVEYKPIDSEGSVFEMSEVYAKSIKRNTSFWDIENLSTTDVCIETLNNFTDRTTAPTDGSIITGKTLFRGSSPDETVGPYVSQFLYLDFNYGNIKVVQKYEIEDDSEDSVTKQGWLNIQNGVTPGGNNKTGQEFYCFSGRVLGSKVHSDPLYQFYYNAALIAFQNGIGPSAFSHGKTTAWVSGGGPDVLASLAHVALGALRVAWYQKYCVTMRIRPEVYAQRIQLAYESSEDFVKKVQGLKNIKDICDSKCLDLLQAVMTANNSTERYLKLQFPEGSPTHPSTVAGHAAVAGACVTILKAMLDTHDSNGLKKAWPETVVHSLTGEALDPYTGSTTGMTIVGELNKLASNVSLGRDWSAVHYRVDGDLGLVLGQDYAITYLVDKCKEYSESYNKVFEGFTLEKFSGETVKITLDGVEAV